MGWGVGVPCGAGCRLFGAIGFALGWTPKRVLLVPQSDAPYFLQDLSFGASRSMMAMR